MKLKATVTTQVEITLELMAQLFTDLTDDEQARFFVLVANAPQWPSTFLRNQQAYAIGSHLRTCECATQEARDFVREIAAGLKTGQH